MRTLITIAALLCAACPAQEARKAPAPVQDKTIIVTEKHPPIISAEDQLALRNAQVDAQQLAMQSLQLQNRQAELQQAMAAAQGRQNELYRTIVAKYKIDEKTQTVCDGPGAAGTPCAGLSKGEIRVVENKKEEEAKK